MESEKRLTPNRDSIENDSFSGQIENSAGDHEISTALSADEELPTQSFSWSVRKVLILTALCLVTVLAFAALSLIAPFFPHEAQERGVSTALVGLIFGTYPLMVFFSAPFCGLLIAKYGPNKVLFFGIFCGATALILFGFCAWISSTTEFVVLSFLLRALSAFGGAASETSVMSVLMEEFTDRLGMASGLIETFVGVGLSVGAIAGGGLYEIGGFSLPFFVNGCSMLAIFPVLICVLSSECGVNSGKHSIAEEKAEKASFSFPLFEAFKIPSVMMIAVCFTTAGLTQVYYEPILGPHLEKVMNLDTTQVGLVFLVNAAVYALTTPLAGWIGDITRSYRWLTVSGYIGAGFGFFLLGPAPFLTFFLPTKSVWFACLSMAIIGFSWGIYFVQVMPDLVEITREQGMPDNSATRGLVSSIFSGMFNLGSAIGPILAAIIDQHIGFQWAMVIAGIISFLQALALAVFTLLEGTEAERRKNPYSPIPDFEEELDLDSARE